MPSNLHNPQLRGFLGRGVGRHRLFSAVSIVAPFVVVQLLQGTEWLQGACGGLPWLISLACEVLSVLLCCQCAQRYDSFYIHSPAQLLTAALNAGLASASWCVLRGSSTKHATCMFVCPETPEGP